MGLNYIEHLLHLYRGKLYCDSYHNYFIAQPYLASVCTTKWLCSAHCIYKVCVCVCWGVCVHLLDEQLSSIHWSLHFLTCWEMEFTEEWYSEKYHFVFIITLHNTVYYTHHCIYDTHTAVSHPVLPLCAVVVCVGVIVCVVWVVVLCVVVCVGGESGWRVTVLRSGVTDL